MDEETKKRIAEIKIREKHATSGEWVEGYGAVTFDDVQIAGEIDRQSNASFIAHARQDVPFLLDALEKADAKFETGLIASNRRALCDVLERLGADGAWYLRSDMTIEDLHGEIVRFTRENEKQAAVVAFAKGVTSSG